MSYLVERIHSLLVEGVVPVLDVSGAFSRAVLVALSVLLAVAAVVGPALSLGSLRVVEHGLIRDAQGL